VVTAVHPLVRIPSPHDIATKPIYTCGTWRDPVTGRNLREFLVDTVGRFEASRVLADAADIAAGVRNVPMPAKQPRPLPGVDRVWSYAGVDHDPIHMHQVTVCGAVIPAPFVYEPAADYDNSDATPCPDCFEGEPR
jgi:hypothetical protein